MIYFFIDIGTEFGYGNLFRCIPIQKEFLKNNDDAIIVYNAINKIEFKIQNSIHLDWHKKIDILKIKSLDIVIIDSYSISKKNLNLIKWYTNKVFIIDDYGKKIFANEKIIDWSIGSHASKRLNLSDKKCIIGAKYAPIRNNFNQKKNKVKIKKNIKKVLIMFGGSDVNNLTIPILELLIKNFKKFKFTVLFIQKKKNCHKLNILKKNKNVNLVHNARENNLVSIMLNSDLAIVSGGHVIFELAFLGLPTIHIKSTHDQVVSIPWQNTGFTRYAGSIKHKNLYKNVIKEVNYYNLLDNRLNSSICGKNFVDGLGAERLIIKIKKMCKNI